MPVQPEYLRVIDQITERIASGAYVAGQALPPIRELADEYGTSVGTMRRATDLLKDRGVLEGRQGVRLYVAARPNG